MSTKKPRARKINANWAAIKAAGLAISIKRWTRKTFALFIHIPFELLSESDAAAGNFMPHPPFGAPIYADKGDSNSTLYEATQHAAKGSKLDIAMQAAIGDLPHPMRLMIYEKAALESYIFPTKKAVHRSKKSL
jgi:hypothetical protein